jgi:hypothetical protein
MAVHTIPGSERAPTDYQWQRSPVGLVSGSDETAHEFSAIDLMLPYWMGRAAEVIPGPAQHDGTVGRLDPTEAGAVALDGAMGARLATAGASGRDVLLWLSPGSTAEMAATTAYLQAHKDVYTTISPTVYGLSDAGELSNNTTPEGFAWAASLKKSGFRVVPIVYADDSHNPVGLRKLRLLARNPQPFIDALVAGVKVRGGRPAIPHRYFLSPRGG